MTNTEATATYATVSRAQAYIDNAHRLGLSDAQAMQILDAALDAEFSDYDEPGERFCHLAAVDDGFFDSDDDFDDFRAEVRTALGL